MDKTYIKQLYTQHKNKKEHLNPAKVGLFFTEVLALIFPELSDQSFANEKEMEVHLAELKSQLKGFLQLLNKQNAEHICPIFWRQLFDLQATLLKDVDAMFMGDPAAKSKEEVVLTYPGFFAIAAYRIANALWILDVAILPRLITEFAHSKTGIDIHPGATIGDYFCIDHGTGIVIGETSHIGKNVKIYQGVTLGALSVNKEDADLKRHPTIEDGVILYSGANILGGKTVIGENTIVGGNVWLTRSLPANSKVYYSTKVHNKDTDNTDIVTIKTD